MTFALLDHANPTISVGIRNWMGSNQSNKDQFLNSRFKRKEKRLMGMLFEKFIAYRTFHLKGYTIVLSMVIMVVVIVYNL